MENGPRREGDSQGGFPEGGGTPRGGRGRQGEGGLGERGSPWEGGSRRGRGSMERGAGSPWVPRTRVPTPAPWDPADTPRGMRAARSLALSALHRGPDMDVVRAPPRSPPG